MVFLQAALNTTETPSQEMETTLTAGSWQLYVYLLKVTTVLFTSYSCQIHIPPPNEFSYFPQFR